MQLAHGYWGGREGRSVDIGFETSEIGNIPFRPFAFLDRERPLCAGIKPRRSGKGFCMQRARYSDILISGVFLLTTSSLPPWNTHPRFTEFIIRLQPALSPYRELPGDHLTGDSAVSTVTVFFHGTGCRQKENPDPPGRSNSSFVCGKIRSLVIVCHRSSRS